MRRMLLCGVVGFGLLSGGEAFAQFASDRTPAPFGGASAVPKQPLPAPPSGSPSQPSPTPVIPGGLEPAGGVMSRSAFDSKLLPGGMLLPDPRRTEELKQVPTTIDDKAGEHPWAVKADLGPWMICVRSYVGSDSRKQAEALAADLRKTHKVAAYLYERNGEQRRAEKARVEAIRQAENKKAQPFLEAMKQAKAEAAAKGYTFIDDAAKIKVPVPYHETPEQWAVLIGPFESMEGASKMLPAVKRLPTPKDESLCDRELVGAEVKDPKTGKSEWKSQYHAINPYGQSFVSRNPMLIEKPKFEDRKLDDFTVELNDGVKHSLLAAKKPYTLMVKAYTMPTKSATAAATSSVFGSKKAPGSSTADLLQGATVEAESLVAALRDPGMKPRSYDAYVFHHSRGSIVTVGQFDSADDAALLELQQELKGITFVLHDEKKKARLDRDGKPMVQRLFDSVHPFPVPKK